MSFLIDTNVLSELVKEQPSREAFAWMETAPENTVFMSAISIMELRLGTDLLPVGKRRTRLTQWLAELLVRFDGRILSVTANTADMAGKLAAEARRTGFLIDTADALIAATAVEHGLTLVTRNVKHFAPMRIDLFNPWLGPTQR